MKIFEKVYDRQNNIYIIISKDANPDYPFGWEVYARTFGEGSAYHIVRTLNEKEAAISFSEDMEERHRTLEESINDGTKVTDEY